MQGILTAWGRILSGYAPALSIEITRECPLRCPGCYAYGDDHLNGSSTLRQLHDFRGQELVDRLLALVDEHKPLHVSIVGGEPLVRYRELNEILPALSARNVYVQLVTSAVREIPSAWRNANAPAAVLSRPFEDQFGVARPWTPVLYHLDYAHTGAVAAAGLSLFDM